jgi:hypothetical protein
VPVADRAERIWKSELKARASGPRFCFSVSANFSRGTFVRCSEFLASFPEAVAIGRDQEAVEQ